VRAKVCIGGSLVQLGAGDSSALPCVRAKPGRVTISGESDPSVRQWCIVVDNLNTHQSEALVRWIATLLGPEKRDLGKKGQNGILKNMQTRAAFLSDPTHPVYFVYTPKHCSWLNQIEIWFAILTKRLLRFGNFTSQQNLKEQLLAFIEYFNKTMAKPFKWTFNGKPLCV